MFDEHVSEDTKVAMVRNCRAYPPNPLFMRQLDTSGHDVPWPLTNDTGGIFHKERFIIVQSSWYSVKAYCSRAIGRYIFPSTKTKLNVKLLKVVDDYHNAEYGVVLI